MRALLPGRESDLRGRSRLCVVTAAGRAGWGACCVCVWVCVCGCVWVCVGVCVVCVGGCGRVWMGGWVGVNVCIYVCVCVCE